MSDLLKAFIQETEKMFKPINITRTHVSWASATTGSPEASEREKEA